MQSLSASSLLPTDEDLAFLTASELVTLFQTRDVSPVEAIKAVLNRIRYINPIINSYSRIDEQRALQIAAASEKRWLQGIPSGLLDGVPMSVKDTLMVEGYPFRRGSKATSSEPAQESSPAVEKAILAGANIVGITTTPEFGSGPATISPLTGITRNPWNPERASGGSSGGAAASVAAGACQLALATDAGGSIRIPSAFCAVVGMKPTGGLVATYPANVAGAMASPGPIARSVRDVAMLLTVICGPDRRDPEAFPNPKTDFQADLEKGVAGLRIAFSPTLGYATNIDPEVLDLTVRAAHSFESMGAIVERSDPGFQNPIDTYITLFHSGLAFALRQLTSDQRDQLGDRLRSVISEGQNVTLFDYLAAQDARRALGRKMIEFHEKYDLLVTPTVAIPAFDAALWSPAEHASESHGRAWTPYCYPFNLTQQPAITVPSGFTRDGLPVGLHIVGPKYADQQVLQAAYAYELSRSFEIGRPTV